MSIAKMKHIRAIALSSERDDLLAGLLHAGCVEIVEPVAQLSDPEWTALLHKDPSNLGDAKAKLNAVNTAIEALRKYAPPKASLFVIRRDIREAEFLDGDALDAALKNAAAINEKTQRIAQLFTQANRISAQRANLIPWAGLDLPLETTGTEHTRLSFATCPAGVELGEVRAALQSAVPTAQLTEAAADKELHYVLLLCHKDESEALTEALRPWSFSFLSFKEFTGTAGENIARIDNQLKESEAERAIVIQEIVDMAPCRDALRVCVDRLTAELDKEAVREKLLTNGTVVFFDGWVPESALAAAETALGRFTCAWETEEPAPEEEPPILLQNPKWMTPINMVTEMYSLPNYHNVDPNPLIFWFFLFFFGFMFADVAYGIIIWAVCFIIERKFHPKFTMGYMFKLGQYMGAATFLCGIFTGGFFGDLIPKFAENMLGILPTELPAWFQTFNNGIIVNPINDPMTALLLSVAIGAVHLVFGQLIHIYLGIRDKDLASALLDVLPWWAFFAAIALVAVAGFPWWTILVACGILVATQGHTKHGFVGKLFGGVASLYDVTQWLSDILSYTRLMALMLATSVIASVMNTLGTLGGLSVGGIILFVVVFLVGHTFNIGVNVIGTYVHAARLQYLEFFSKFYEEGGEPFSPLTYKTKFVDIIEEEK